MDALTKWASGRLGAYYAALAARGHCAPPLVYQLPDLAFRRFYSEANVGTTVAAPAGPGVGICAPAGKSKPTPNDKISATATATGGAAKPKTKRPAKHVVVDTLNVLHALDNKPSTGGVVATIDATAPVLRASYPGRIMYVVKDRDSRRNTDAVREAYGAVARRHRVIVYAVEQYAQLPCAAALDAPGAQQAGAGDSPRHSARARDDFYAAVLADRWAAPVVTADRFRDFHEWRRTLTPFYVDEYSYSADPAAPPVRYYVSPNGGAYERLLPPTTVRPRRLFSNIVRRNAESTNKQKTQ